MCTAWSLPCLRGMYRVAHVKGQALNPHALLPTRLWEPPSFLQNLHTSLNACSHLPGVLQQCFL